jgi:decaprenylphospho-beta-D-ribofuranose 2-oxidase
MELSGWGRFPKHNCVVTAPRNVAALAAQIAAGPLIARGNGRSYGDSATSLANTVEMRHFDHLIAFDDETGQVTAEAGVLLSDIIATYLPRGWFPAVTPGTKFVTLGGCIAADVHGKNHHLEGSFGAFVDWLDVMGADGQITRCSRTEHPNLFGWTLGGMGLTGVIIRAAFRMRRVTSGWIKQTMIPTQNLTEALAAFEENLSSTYSVAWIDCLASGNGLGRSLVMLGEHATPDDLPISARAEPFVTPKKLKMTVPFDAPGFALNPLSVMAFNAGYYGFNKRKAGASIVDWDTYFYPLDAILQWNRIYGKRGFMQFQCVLPQDTATKGLTKLLETISASGQASFLSVLKRFGPQDSAFSFPMAGYTLALDFPLTTRSLALMPRLDRITLAHGGRFYLAKDSRITAQTLATADPRAAAFKAMRQEAGLTQAFASAQSERLGL